MTAPFILRTAGPLDLGIFTLRFLSWVCGLGLLTATLAQAADAIGFREIALGKGGARPLHVSLWYPAKAQGNTVAVGEDRAFAAIQAIPDGSPIPSTPKGRPLVVLSHGYGGNWRNLNWMAVALVEHGWIVAAPDHPGTTTFDKNPTQAAGLRERPRDLSRVIDALTADASLAGPVDTNRIAAIGHSLGGWTVVALAGARFDPALFEKDCRANPSLHACNFEAAHSPALTGDLGDPRLGAFVALDIGVARGFSPESLAAIRIPSLVISAGIDIGDMPAKLESGYLTEHLPKTSTTSVEIPDAMHFSFLQRCKPGAAAWLEAQSPGDGIVCRDGQNRSRDEIHREVAERVIGFLGEAIPAK